MWLRSFFSSTSSNEVTNPSTASNAAEKPNNASASCPPWRRPNARVRLHVKANVVRIYGYPVSPPPANDPELARCLGFGSSGRLFLYLRGTSPAHVNYIMGSSWRERLQSASSKDIESVGIEDGDGVILRPKSSLRAQNSDGESSQKDVNDDALVGEMEQHCLYMRRCGAIYVNSQPEIAMRETMFADFPPQPADRQIFGWVPESDGGGVYVLPVLSPSQYQDLSIEEQMAILDSGAAEEETSRFEAAKARLKTCETMSDFCNVLKTAGAKFYSDVTECPEVRKLGLS